MLLIVNLLGLMLGFAALFSAYELLKDLEYIRQNLGKLAVFVFVVLLYGYVSLGVFAVAISALGLLY